MRQDSIVRAGWSGPSARNMRQSWKRTSRHHQCECLLGRIRTYAHTHMHTHARTMPWRGKQSDARITVFSVACVSRAEARGSGARNVAIRWWLVVGGAANNPPALARCFTLRRREKEKGLRCWVGNLARIEGIRNPQSCPFGIVDRDRGWRRRAAREIGARSPSASSGFRLSHAASCAATASRLHRPDSVRSAYPSHHRCLRLRRLNV